MLANEDVESVEDNDHGKVDQGEPSSVWLELALEDKCITVNALGEESLVELDIRDADRAPGEQRSNSRQVLEPLECGLGATLSYGKVGKGCNRGSNGNAEVWDTGLAATKEEARSLLVLCKSKEVTRSGVQESVRRRRGRCQDDRVDDRWKDGNTGILDTNNPRRLSSANTLTAKQMWIIRGDEDTDCQGAEDIEEQDTPEDSADCLGNVLAGVLGFTCSDCDQFYTTIREGSVHENVEQTQESPSVSS